MASDADVHLSFAPAIAGGDVIPLTLLRRVLSKIPEGLPGVPAPALDDGAVGVPAASVHQLLFAGPGVRSRLSLRQRCWLRDAVMQPPASESGSHAAAGAGGPSPTKLPNGPTANGSPAANGATAVDRRNGDGACRISAAAASGSAAATLGSPSRLVWLWRVAMPNARSNYWASSFKPLEGFVEFPAEWLGRALALPAASKDEVRAVNACRDALLAAAHHGDTDALTLLARDSKHFR